jgi:hypothetical protein
MTRLIGTFLLLALAGAAARADDTAKSAAAKKKAGEIVEAMKKSDYARLIDLTYPKAIELAGGRESAIRAVEEEMKRAKDQGFSFRSIEAGEPGEILEEGKNSFVVVPTSMEMTAPGGRLVLKSYLLGISSDGGNAWTFIEGVGLRTAEQREQVLPRLPEKLKLPEVGKPRVIKGE